MYRHGVSGWFVFVLGEWRNGHTFQHNVGYRQLRPTMEALRIREEFKRCFTTVPDNMHQNNLHTL